MQIKTIIEKKNVSKCTMIEIIFESFIHLFVQKLKITAIQFALKRAVRESLISKKFKVHLH